MAKPQRVRKRNLRFSISNIIITGFLLGSFVLFSLRFFTELNSTVQISTNAVAIGEIAELHGHVQRRLNQQLQWKNLGPQEILYSLDAVRTGEGASTVILLNSKNDADNEVVSEIQLGPETYVVLEITEDTRNIAFTRGNISATRAQGLTLSTEDTMVEAETGSVALNRTEGQETSIQVTEGVARVVIKGNRTTVNTSSTLQIDEKSGQTSEVQVAILPIAPKPNALLLTYSTSRQVDFSWELFADQFNHVLEISRDPNFKDDTIRHVFAEDFATLDMEQGRWYWRIQDVDSDESGLINIFTVQTERLVTPRSPAQGLTIPYQGDAASINFQWDTALYANSYTLEIADNPLFTNKQVFEDVRANSILVNSLTAGQWWWRVISHHRRGRIDKEILPDSWSFSLERQSGYEKIELVAPFNNRSFSSMEVMDGVRFRWQGQKGIISYRIDISQDPDFNRLLDSEETPTNWITLLESPAPGTYYWRVAATTTDNQPVPASRTQSFEIGSIAGTIELIEPESGETKRLEPYANYSFTWRSQVEGNYQFLLQRLVGDTRQRVIESITREQSFSIPLTDTGTYIWKVQLLDKSENPLMVSPERSFDVIEPLEPPTLLVPNPGERISLRGSTDINLHWSSGQGADAYRVVITSPNDTVIASNNRMEDTKWELPLPGTPITGAYKVELASIQDNPLRVGDNLSQSARFLFFIDEVQLYNAAIPVLPRRNAVFNLETALRNGILLRWTQDPLLDRWTVELNNEGFTQLIQSENPQVVLNNLIPGEYRWQVRSWDENETEAPISLINRFTIRDFPVPPQPIVSIPTAGSDIDMTGAKNLRFEWQDSPGAGYYNMVLYKEESRVPILQEKGLTRSYYVVNDLKILNVGNFVLEVTALREYAEEGAIRFSKTTRVPFSLSINIPKKSPKILSDELLYAN